MENQEESKIYQQEVLDESLYSLRDELRKNGVVLQKEYYRCKNALFSVWLVLLGNKVYYVKNVNRHCIKIVSVSNLAKEAKKYKNEK